MLKILNHFKKAWEAYKRNFPPIIISIALIIIIFSLLVGVGFFAILGTEGATEVVNHYIISEGTTDFESPEFLNSINMENIGFFFLFLILGVIITIFLEAGFWGICLKGIKKKVSTGLFFTTIRERGISYFLANILVLLIIVAISLPLILIFYGLFYLLQANLFLSVVYPMIFLLIAPFFIFIFPAVIEGKPIFNSVSQSFIFGKKYYLDLILLPILFYVSSLLSFIPIVGVILNYFLIVPLLVLLICSFYLEVSKSGREKKSRKTKKTGKSVRGRGKSKTRKRVVKGEK